MSLLKRFGSNLQWAISGQARYIDHPEWMTSMYWMIETKTGDYIHKTNGERKAADRRSIAAVNNSFYTIKRLKP